MVLHNFTSHCFKGVDHVHSFFIEKDLEQTGRCNNDFGLFVWREKFNIFTLLATQKPQANPP